MALYKQDIVDVDLNTGNIFRSFMNHSIGFKDDDANRFGIRAFRDGEPVDLTGVSCQAVFMAPNGNNIALTSYGTVSGNVAYVTLPQACYDYEGQFCLAIKLVGGGVTGTVRIVDGTVTQTGASGAVAPTAAVPTYQEILAVYADMQEDIEDYESVVANQNDQINSLKSAITAITGNAIYPFTEGKYINTSGTTVNIGNPSSADGYRYALADCVEGDIFYVSGRGSIIAGLWAFIQSDGTIISKSDTTSQETDLKITAPANSAYLIVNSNRQTVKCQKGTLVKARLDTLETEMEDANSYIDDIKIYDQSGNIFQAKTGFLEGAYYYKSGANLVTGVNANYNGFIIPVAKSSVYIFVTSNIVLLDAEQKPLASGGSWDYEGVTSCNSGNASYFAVTYRLSNVPQDGYAISKGYVLDYGTYSDGYYAKTATYTEKSNVRAVTGAIASGGSLNIGGKTAVKDGQEIVFKGKFNSFNEVKIDFVSSGSTNYVSVNGTNLIVSNNTNNTITEPHGLTIENEITVLLELKKSNMYISITSKGITFKYNCFWNQTGGIPVELSAKAISMAFTTAKFSTVFSSAKRNIWYFGDSYAQFGTDTRIPYYMVEYGYDENVLFNAVSGGTSAGGRESFNTLLTYGTPKFAVFALGMNNGDTDASTPNTSWLNNVQEFIQACDGNGITPILCTIPTVPNVINEAKNTWVRNSGKRYIDYASAVGANSNGEWYGNGTAYDMLSSDRVHPSKYGGNALFTQLITDLPEVMQSDL